MIYIGNHVSISLGYEGMLEKEKELGGNTFAFFTRNPRSFKDRKVSMEDVRRLALRLKEENFGPLVAHMPYTINLCSEKEDLREVSLRILKEDILLMNELPSNYLNFHPGSRLSQPLTTAIDEIAYALNEALPYADKTTVLLETMAGKGSEVGSKFQELKAIIDKVKDNEKLGVCLDTCHVFDSGYDIKDEQSYTKTMAEFDKIVGFKYLSGMHINDSKGALGSRKDRHDSLVAGLIV